MRPDTLVKGFEAGTIEDCVSCDNSNESRGEQTNKISGVD